MKQTIALTLGLLVLLAFTTTAAEPPQAPDLMPVPMRPAPRHAPVELVRQGEPCAVVYVADPVPSFNLKKIVDELVEAVRLSAGAVLPVVTNAPSAGQTAIVIGDCEETRRAGIDAAKLPIEGFEVRTASNRVYLVGSTMALPSNQNISDAYANDGTAWALADFMERFVGVRWYWPVELGGRTVVKSQTIRVPPAHYGDAPVFRKRTHWPSWYELPSRMQGFKRDAHGSSLDGKAATRCDMQPGLQGLRSGNSWPYLVKVHEPQNFRHGNSDPWIKEHEGMFALRKDGTRNTGMLCYSSTQALDFIVGGCQAWDEGKKRPSWVTELCVTVSPGDEPVDCQCPDCRRMFDASAPHHGFAGGEASRLMGRFVKKVCDEVKRRWPGKKVIYLPYWNYTLCPEEVEFPDNLEIEMCTTGFSDFRDTAIREGIEKNLRAWSRKVGGKITTWEYSCWAVNWTPAPLQFPHLVRDYYRSNRDVLAGSFVNGDRIQEWSQCAPSLYVWMRVLWNPDIDVDATLDEMCARLFGEGAKTSRALLRLMCDRWEKARRIEPMPQAMFRDIWPPDVVAEMEKLWRQARDEMKDDPVAIARFDYWNCTFEAFLKEAGIAGARTGGKP